MLKDSHVSLLLESDEPYEVSLVSLPPYSTAILHCQYSTAPFVRIHIFYLQRVVVMVLVLGAHIYITGAVSSFLSTTRDGDGLDGDGVGVDSDGLDGDGVGVDGDGVGLDGDGVGADGDGVGVDGDGVDVDGDGVGVDGDGIDVVDVDDVGVDGVDGVDGDGVGVGVSRHPTCCPVPIATLRYAIFGQQWFWLYKPHFRAIG